MYSPPLRSCRFTLARFATAIAAIAALAWPLAAMAGLYKCARDDGTVMYQEDPCPSGRELRDFERDPATVSVVPFSAPPQNSTELAPGSRASSARSTESRKSGDNKTRASTKAKAEGGAINAAERKFLVPGIGEGDVVARIGRPDMSTAAGRKTIRWTYLPAPDDPSTITTLTFELGRLIQVERKVVRLK